MSIKVGRIEKKRYFIRILIEVVLLSITEITSFVLKFPGGKLLDLYPQESSSVLQQPLSHFSTLE